MVFGTSAVQDVTVKSRSCSGVSWFDESIELIDFLQQHPTPQAKAQAAPRPQKQLPMKDSGHTTVMLQNIPNKYTRDMLVDRLGRTGFKSEIDYLYLPIDFGNRCNIGYCFINFRTVAARQRFTKRFDGVAVQSCLPGFNSRKVCKVTRAKLQGREENLRRLRTSSQLMAQLAQHPDWLPLLFNESGDEEAFSDDDDGAKSQASYSSHCHQQAVGMYAAAAPVGSWGGGWTNVPMAPMAPMMIGLPIASGEWESSLQMPDNMHPSMQHGMLQSMQQHGMQHHGMQQHGMHQHGMHQHGMHQQSMQHQGMQQQQQSMQQHSTLQLGKQQQGMQQHSMQQHGMQQHGMQQQCMLQQGMLPQGMQCATQCQFGGMQCLVLYEPSCHPSFAWNAVGGCSGYTTSASGGGSSSPRTEFQDERETIPDSSRGTEPYDDDVLEEM